MHDVLNATSISLLLGPGGQRWKCVHKNIVKACNIIPFIWAMLEIFLNVENFNTEIQIDNCWLIHGDLTVCLK